MYKEYWGLKENPFENAPDPRFLYRSAQHEEAMTRMLYVVRNRKGAGMLTGTFGCGKTLVAQAIVMELGKEKYKVAIINNPRLDEVDLLRMIAYLLGAVEPPERKTDVLIVLNNILADNAHDAKDTVVIIDEAHCIENKGIFEELRLLLNFQLPNRFLLTLLLFGQPELLQKIEANKQLKQRIGISYNLDKLDLKETEEYINNRLDVGGVSDRKIFNEEAMGLVYNCSGGIPRKINQICDMALFVGFCTGKKSIDEQTIKEVSKDFMG